VRRQIRLPLQEAGSEGEVTQEQCDNRNGAEQASAPGKWASRPFLRSHAGGIIALLCLYAGLRILIFAAAFPTFNNVDEQFHLLSIRMYALGQWPNKELPSVDYESAKLFALYGTTEYFVSPQRMERFHLRAPLYQLSPQEADPYLAASILRWLERPDFEAQSTPLYYLLGAAWYRIGEALGMRAWEIPYWIRFLNPAAYVLLIWASYRFVRTVYPDRIFLWLGVPALLAVFPQDVYFGISRDVLSAPIAAVALLLMVKTVNGENSRVWLPIAASMLVGLAFLGNVSNIVLYGALALTLWFWTRRSTASRLATTSVALASVIAAGTLPAAWMLRNYTVMGDLIGSRAKVEYLGWTMKPIGQLFDHPLFSFGGLSYFLANLTRTFWRGEYVWHGQPMRWPPADWFYLLSSCLMVLVFTLQYFRRRKHSRFIERFAEFQVLFLVLASVLFMAAISLPFDFHDCFYPSRAHPFFISGRIISCVLPPFALIYVSALESLLRPLRKWISPAAVLCCLLLFISITEFQVRRNVFSSPNNFFAFRAWQQSH